MILRPPRLNSYSEDRALKDRRELEKTARCREAVIEGISVPVGTPVTDVLARAEQKMKRCGIPVGSLHFRLYKKSVDARKREDIRLVY